MNRETAEAAVAQETAEDKTEAAAVEKAEVVSETDKEKETEEIGTKETMEDYSKELEASFRTIREGDIISGSVIDVNEEGVTLDLNYYASGVIKAEDMSKDPSFSIMADVHVGDVIEATVVKRDDGAGNIQLSRVEAADVLGWDKVQKYLEEKTVVTVKVAETVNKGVVAFLEGIRGFIPASHLSLSYVEDLNTFVGKELEVYVITVEKGKKKLVLSAREVLKEKEAEALNHRIAMVVPGTVMEGKVESIMPYGAFVDLGDGLSGLVHVSQISQKRIKTPSEVLNVGDTVKVKVLNTKDNKISLSMKAVAETAEATDAVDEKTAAKYSSRESIGTSLGDLLKGIKL
ncbi:MAG: S1 RNA-binding domain-containing protein [Lachnospiraceae bacterium]|nr:S1 RNA-binding domain-containing protein [Lachnospiraceae bacterium]